jgi:hypothetical protein
VNWDLVISGFVSLPARTRWIENEDVRVYMRKGHRIVSARIGLVHTLEVANVQVGNGERERTGKLRPLLEALDRQKFVPTLYCENVFDERLRNILERHNWRKIPNPYDPNDDAPCYYKRLPWLYGKLFGV